MAEKRRRTRAIIFIEDSIVTMYREVNGRKYFTFPGGGMEKDETEQQCVKREVVEEFGMVVEPIKKVYTYENEISIEHFWICKWMSGDFASGKGEEYQADRNKGVYRPTKMKISNISKSPLMPPEVAEQFVADFNKNSKELRNNVLKINGKLN